MFVGLGAYANSELIVMLVKIHPKREALLCTQFFKCLSIVGVLYAIARCLLILGVISEFDSTLLLPCVILIVDKLPV